ncbi:MAG: pilus assembly protein PilM [Sedimentisphaerales bacterium]|nr:pilus assembly protein PilM [Sedimentisphaerales bacterium]
MLNIKNTFGMLKSNSALEKLKTSGALRMLRTKTALGVDISDKQINLALVKRGKNGVELLASAAAPVTAGAVKNGSIENIAALAGAVKKLKNSCKIRTTRAAVSLFTEPVIVQILNVPRQVPTNIGQFVHEQVKNFAVLPGNQIASDFYGVAGAGSEAGAANRLLVVATDGRKVADIVKVCNQAGLTVEAIEPPLLAYIRTLYAKKIAGKFDCNVLTAILEGNNLTLCVFKKQALDFVRTKSFSKVQGAPDGENSQPNDICQWLAEQINTVIQFYDVEAKDGCGKWEITVVADFAKLPQNAKESLKTKIVNTNLQLMTSEDICRDAVVSQSSRPANRNQPDKSSPVALGLAMKLLDTNARNSGVNLLPAETVRLRATQRESLVTANILAAVLLIMILAVSWPAWKIKKLNESINQKKALLLQDADTLVSERTSVNEKIDSVSGKLSQINEVLDSHSDTNWPKLLNDIGKGIPKTVCITSLSGVTNSGMSLKGLALSNEAVYLFADKLNKSEHISAASIAGTKKDKSGFISYEINCALTPKKGI